jgi:hypothetical protein
MYGHGMQAAMEEMSKEIQVWKRQAAQEKEELQASQKQLEARCAVRPLRRQGCPRT